MRYQFFFSRQVAEALLSGKIRQIQKLEKWWHCALLVARGFGSRFITQAEYRWLMRAIQDATSSDPEIAYYPNLDGDYWIVRKPGERSHRVWLGANGQPRCGCQQFQRKRVADKHRTCPHTEDVRGWQEKQKDKLQGDSQQLSLFSAF